MAASRLEKIGTIFSRVTGLLRAGAKSWDDKPLWYNVYRAFPPINELTYGSPKPDTPIRNIFYAEDKIRAKFHSDFRSLAAIHLDDRSTPSQCQLLIQEFRNIREKYNKPEDEAYSEAYSLVIKSVPQSTISKRHQFIDIEEEDSQDNSVSSEFKIASTKDPKTVDSAKLIADVFKEEK